MAVTRLTCLLMYLPGNPLSKARQLSVLCWQPTFWFTGVCTAWLCTGCRCTARGVVLPHGTNSLRAMSLRFKACSAARIKTVPCLPFQAGQLSWQLCLASACYAVHLA